MSDASFQSSSEQSRCGQPDAVQNAEVAQGSDSSERNASDDDSGKNSTTSVLRVESDTEGGVAESTSTDSAEDEER